MADSLIRKIYGKRTIERLNKKSMLLNLSNNFSGIFLLFRLLVSIIISVFLYILLKIDHLFLAFLFSGLFYVLFEKILIDIPIYKRKLTLEKQLKLFLEVFKSSLFEENDLYKVIENTTSHFDNNLSNEFKSALKRTKYGMPLNESLTILMDHIPSKEINHFVFNLIEKNSYDKRYQECFDNNQEYDLNTNKEIINTYIKISLILLVMFIPLFLGIIYSMDFIDFLLN